MLYSCGSVRVSNELGAGNPEGARLVVGVALSVILCSAVLVSVTLLALRHFIGIAFSNEEEVINYVTRMVPVLSISVITDSLQGVLSGIKFTSKGKILLPVSSYKDRFCFEYLCLL